MGLVEASKWRLSREIATHITVTEVGGIDSWGIAQDGIISKERQQQISVVTQLAALFLLNFIHVVWCCQSNRKLICEILDEG